MPSIAITEGVRAPLFDRLAEEERGRAGILDRAELYQSLQRELERLLNTRSPHLGDQLPVGERTVIDYGLPDYTAMYTRSHEDQKRLAALIRGTIEAYEPRLSEVRVEAEVLGNSEKAVLVKVAGVVALGRIMERVSFVINVTGEDLRGRRIGD